MDIRRYYNFLGSEFSRQLWAGVQTLEYVPWRTGSGPHLHAELANQALPNTGLLGRFVQQVRALDTRFCPVRCYINLHHAQDHFAQGRHQDDQYWTWVYYLPTDWRSSWGAGTDFYSPKGQVIHSEPWCADSIIGFRARHWHAQAPVSPEWSGSGTRAVIVTKCARAH